MRAPTFDSFTLHRVARELREDLLDGQIQRIRQPDEWTIGIAIHRRGATRWMMLSWHQRLFRAGLADTQPGTMSEPPPFCMALRKHLEGARVTSVAQAGADRILSVTASGALGDFELVAELMGRNSIVALVGGDGTTLATSRRFPRAPDRRDVTPGHRYPRFGADARLSLWEMSGADLAALIAASPDCVTPAWLKTHFAGVSPFLVSHVTSSPEPAEALAALRAAAGASGSDGVTFVERGTAVGAWPVASPAWPAADQRPVPSLARAVEAVAQALGSEETGEEARREVMGALKRRRDRLARRLAGLEEDERRAARSEEWRISGEILAANTHAVERGATSVTLPNWYDPEGGTLEVTLDPRLGPRENADALFARARKARLAGERVPAERETLLRGMADVDAEMAEAASADKVELARRLAALRASARSPEPSARHEREYPAGVRIRRIETPEGFTVLVGENATGNDWLTTKVADPDDIWLHVRAAASAHAVIRTGRQPERVPLGVLRRAAELVAARSEAKGSGVIPVDWTLKRHVRKPRGAGPGRVTYTREKTLFVGPDA